MNRTVSDAEANRPVWVQRVISARIWRLCFAWNEL